MLRFSPILALLGLYLTENLAHAQSLPQCDPTSNGTSFNGTAGSEQQLNSTTLRLMPATDANQGVAVDAQHFYSIDNYSITKHNKSSGEPLLQWYGGEDGPIIHLDGGVVIDDLLYAPHSNYPASPITSSVEVWNTTTMQHIRSHPFGIFRGSLTWIDQDADGTWFGTLANYDRVQPGQMVPYGLTMNTQLVQFTASPWSDNWTVSRAWIFPEALWESFSPMSNSGGSFGPDGWLYITGHDTSEVYVVKLPSAGDVLIWVATIQAPEIAGQGIAWDRSEGMTGAGGEGRLYGISREERQIVEMEVPLQQECGWNVPSAVGEVYGSGQSVLPED